MKSRRNFLRQTAAFAAGAVASPAITHATEKSCRTACTENISLCGEWSFLIDPTNSGIEQRWYDSDGLAKNWRTVEVPHTWQIDAEFADYRGIVWYRRAFDVLQAWSACSV